MKRRYVPIIVVVLAFALTAAVGYLLPEEKQDSPARVVLDNTGGRVIFSHQTHVDDYGFDCADCHHDNIGQDKPLACVTCHPPAFDENFKKNHQKAFPNKKACLRCHATVPQNGKLTKENRPDIASIPTRTKAFHKMCQSCHEENGGPYGKDACYECHAE